MKKPKKERKPCGTCQKVRKFLNRMVKPKVKK